MAVRAYRSASKSFSTPFAAAEAASPGTVSIVDLIRAATSAEQLRDLRRAHLLNWTPGMTELAKDIISRNGWR